MREHILSEEEFIAGAMNVNNRPGMLPDNLASILGSKDLLRNITAIAVDTFCEVLEGEDDNSNYGSILSNFKERIKQQITTNSSYSAVTKVKLRMYSGFINWLVLGDSQLSSQMLRETIQPNPDSNSMSDQYLTEALDAIASVLTERNIGPKFRSRFFNKLASSYGIDFTRKGLRTFLFKLISSRL